jgi:hypothetical protein
MQAQHVFQTDVGVLPPCESWQTWGTCMTDTTLGSLTYNMGRHRHREVRRPYS